MSRPSPTRCSKIPDVFTLFYIAPACAALYIGKNYDGSECNDGNFIVRPCTFLKVVGSICLIHWCWNLVKLMILCNQTEHERIKFRMFYTSIYVQALELCLIIYHICMFSMGFVIFKTMDDGCQLSVVGGMILAWSVLIIPEAICCRFCNFFDIRFANQEWTRRDEYTALMDDQEQMMAGDEDAQTETDEVLLFIP